MSQTDLDASPANAPFPSAAEISIFWGLCNTAEDAPHVIFVTGGPGVGMTTTLERVLARFAGTSTEIVRWHPNHSMPARLRNVLLAHIEPSTVPPPPHGPAAIVIVVDDAHRMPVSTVRLLRQTMSQKAIPRLRLLLVGTHALLAAMPRSTPFRLPGNSCIHVRVRRPGSTTPRKATRRERPSKPRARAKSPDQNTARGGAHPKAKSHRGTATGLLLIAVLVFALLMGDRLTPVSIRPALSKLQEETEATLSMRPPESLAPDLPPPRQGSASTVPPPR